MRAHFIVNTVEGVMIAICGKIIKPNEIRGAKVGMSEDESALCVDCAGKVSAAWVTFVGLQ